MRPYPKLVFVLPNKDTTGLFRAQFWQLVQYSSGALIFFNLFVFFSLVSYRLGTKGCCLNEKNLFLCVLF